MKKQYTPAPHADGNQGNPGGTSGLFRAGDELHGGDGDFHLVDGLHSALTHGHHQLRGGEAGVGGDRRGGGCGGGGGASVVCAHVFYCFAEEGGDFLKAFFARYAGAALPGRPLLRGKLPAYIQGKSCRAALASAVSGEEPLAAFAYVAGDRFTERLRDCAHKVPPVGQRKETALFQSSNRQVPRQGT